MTKMRLILSISSIATALLVSACQTIPSDDDSLFRTANSVQSSRTENTAEFEQAGLLPTSRFISDMCGANCVYQLHPQTYNNGISNSYKITSGDHIFVVEGTAEAKNLIQEVKAISALRQVNTAKVAADTVQDRTIRIAKTPYDIGKSVYDRFDEASNVGEALWVIPVGIGNITSDLVGGLKEMGVTSARLIGNVSHTRCDGLGCVQKASEDFWYGVNTLTGKHSHAARLYAEHGTHHETQNKVLSREVDRLAYTSSYTNTGYKFALANSNIAVVAPPTKGAGYYRNANFLGRYEDSRKIETANKARLAALGVPEKTLAQLYANPAFTRAMRNDLVSNVSQLASVLDEGETVASFADIPARNLARQTAELYQQAARLHSDLGLAQIKRQPHGLIAQTARGKAISILAADYAIWSPEMAEMVTKMTSGPSGQTPQIYVLGEISGKLKSNAERRGAHIVQITPK